MTEHDVEEMSAVTGSQHMDRLGGGSVASLNDPKRPNSIMSIPSKDSKAENLNDILALCEELKFLIKEGEWNNIPAPVRATCEGIIDF